MLTLVLALVTVVGAIGLYKLHAPQNVPAPTLSVQGTPEQIARGKHIAEVMCVGCHSPNKELPLSGGENLAVEAGLSLGDLYVPNLTPGRHVQDWSPANLPGHMDKEMNMNNPEHAARIKRAELLSSVGAGVLVT